MKKITVIVQEKDAGLAVKTLRRLGVLHVEHREPPQGKDIASLRENIATIEKALAVLAEAESRKGAPALPAGETQDWHFTARHIIELHKRLDQLQEYSKVITNNIVQWQDWGDFEPEKIAALEEKNIFIKFYRLPLKEISSLPQGLILKKISVKAGLANCMVITRQKPALAWREIGLPKMGLVQMRAKLSEDSKVMQWLREDIHRHTAYRESLTQTKLFLEKELEFARVLNGMSRLETLAYLAGYVPYDKAGAISASASKERWGIIIDEPSEEDNVPTLIRNPRWVSIINPVFKMIEVVPGYRELDISFWFLVFFSVFFGILIGDAGYGAVFFILTLLAQLRLARKVKQKAVFSLFYLLSGSAIAWGVLSGTFFGQEWLPQWVRPVLPELRSDRSVQGFCFFLGALHLSIAHCWRGIIKFPSLKALADLGWVLILWGAYFLARLLILSDAYPAFTNWLFIAGAALVVFFTNPGRNMLKGIGSGIGNLLLNLVSNFTDIVSYIRLFAVGLATVAVADTFNKMALNIGYGSFLSGLFSSFILILGHGLNILLGPMAILVHGVRLNVLEFCNHLDIKWSGFAYNPLREEADRQGLSPQGTVPVSLIERS